jgi:protocatechuate 3,4-dioxygenase beta subunit
MKKIWTGLQDETNRRETLRLLGAAGVTVLAGCGKSGPGVPGGGAGGTGGSAGAGGSGAGTGGASGTGGPSADAGMAAPTDASAISCVVRPNQIEGPYFLDEKLDRSDIRSDPSDSSVKPGVTMRLGLRVYRIDGAACAPLTGALVDVWQCDALGVYSGVMDVAGAFNTTGKKFLRGYQTVNAAGSVDFVTIFPGWYGGRAIHTHFKIRTAPTVSGGAFEFISQLYFPEDIISAVLATPVYVGHGRPDTPNAMDAFFQMGGDQLVPRVTRSPDGSYDATFDIGLRIT